MKETDRRVSERNPKDTKKAEVRFEVSEPAELMTFLLDKMPHKSRHNIKSYLRDKQVLVDNKAETQYNYKLRVGQSVNIKSSKAPEIQKYKGLTIIYEDQYLIIIEKQEGFLSIATEKQKLYNAYSTLSDHVKKQDPANRIFVVHRLDRETSGLMMFAKSERIQKLLQESWNETIQQRTYLAVVEGHIEYPLGTVRSYLVESKALTVYSTSNPNLGKEAITHYDTIDATEFNTLVKVNLETGRKNQIRVHMKDIGHPIVGDEKYGAKTDPIGRLGLHAWVLSFVHPITDEEMYFETTVPKKFLSLF
ncbi:RluA family pseudouridine synthase [Arcicella lustrica]|uniref:Pseudouridine synthase n=1 Tax=Arcicella lustrica TaxID=2984196 RepID=A0ABU5SMA6_9BACT|nr:RluA family pseudouridine synthase [Arcicella sp. DC25W]MEA5428412.1 RluA family pseudouridine synthase [Arcicella sp. DC25W]|eukprot:GDKJ01059193.1.p1 GENE.GDKJ01059193.1~~GDKJ01059193.1.p1  ORF type:complete len:306 (-),score=41.67 GDKJ01059193.1:1144-2061(-)